MGKSDRRGPAESLKSSLRLCVAHRITVYCPVSRDALMALLAGETARLEQDPAVAPLFNTLRAHAEFGALGPYRNVYEVSGGHESFTPSSEARPVLGTAGETSSTASIIVTTYVAQAVSGTRLAELVAALAASHPWELPVIEVCEVRVLAPATLKPVDISTAAV